MDIITYKGSIMNIPRYIIHDSTITHHLIKHGLIIDRTELKGS
jgi:hypothetical protein